MRRSSTTTSSFGRNILAIAIAGTAAGYAQLDCDPLATGSTPHAIAASAIPPAMSAPPPAPLPVAVSSEESAASPAQSTEDPQVLRGIWGIKMASALIEKGCDSFGKIPDYTATMFKQERVASGLSEVQQIELKVRHEPFSVYMKWHSGDRGRQLIYVQGHNDGNLLVQPGGIKGRLTGVLNLDPHGALAMSESRYPITKAGLLALAQTILEYQREDIARGTGFRCELLDDQMYENRPCFLYRIEYESPEINAEYRKSVIYLDKELSMPVCVRNYTWAVDANPETLDEETLVEYYAYSQLEIHQQLTATDFDHHNRDYHLRVRR